MVFRFFKQRLLYYLLLVLIGFVIPYLMTIIIIILIGDRERGMEIAVIPSILITHFIFSAFFLRTKPYIKFSVPLLTAFVAVMGIKYLLTLGIFNSVFDMYGFWEIAISHLFVAIIIWEITYQIIVKFAHPKPSTN